MSEPACYGIRRKGTTAIVGVVPSKVHAIPPREPEFLKNYEEVPLYTHPPSERVRDAIDSFAHDLEQWAQAYPDDVFPSVTKEEREWLVAQRPGLLDRISAGMARHMANRMCKMVADVRAAIAAEGLKEGE